MEPLPPQMLPAVSHVQFSVFNLAVPDIVFWALVIALFIIAVWAPIPRFLEGS